MKKKINPFSAAILNIGIGIIENTLIELIPNESVQDDVHVLLKPIKNTIRVLRDNNPDNKAQLEQVWIEFVRSNEFNASYQARIMQVIHLIEDDKTREFVSRIAKPCLATIQSLYDNEPNDIEQIKDAWIQFGTNKENISSILAFFISDEDIRDSVAVLIDTIHDGIADLLK